MKLRRLKPVELHFFLRLYDLRENYKFYILIILATLVLSISFFFFQGILSGEQGRVKKFILRGKNAVEAKDIFTCANMVSFSYRDKYGNDRSTLLYQAKEFFAYYSKIFVGIEKMDIKLNEQNSQADIQIQALMIGQTKHNEAQKILEGEKGRGAIKLIKEEGKWKLFEIEFYEQITIMGQNII